MNIITEQKLFRETAAEELRNAAGTVVRLHGSVHKIRKMGGFAFILLRTAEKTVQCIYEEGTAEFPLSDLKENACIRLEAFVKAEERARDGYELVIMTVKILSVPVVINGKKMNASLETRLHYRPITLRNEEERAVFKVQEGVVKGFRNFFYRNPFTEIHTPKIVSSGAEGGANVFGLDYFGRQAYLAQSPQFYKQMMAGVYERVFEIGPVFRAERHDTNRHLNEYTGVDFEMAYIGHYSELMEMETGMLKEAIACVKEEYAPYAAQTKKMKERGMDPDGFESFLMMHRYGMPPHGGLGLGLERFTARLLNRENVREACLFPRDINRLNP